MPHINLPAGLAGVQALFTYRPETGSHLIELVEVLLRGESALSYGERELIAAYVSHLNDCQFCEASHSAFAAIQLDEDWSLVEDVKTDPSSAAISEKLRALLGVAEKVQQGGAAVTPQDIDDARAAGADDLEVHDTVLIAATFCMLNRYVDGLATWSPSSDPKEFADRARTIALHGYRRRSSIEDGYGPGSGAGDG